MGLNAATTHDATKYYVSLPANKAEWWFALESERFRAPVFRQGPALAGLGCPRASSGSALRRRAPAAAPSHT